MDLQEPARKKLKELSDEERKLKERIKEIQTEKKGVFRMLTALQSSRKKRKGRPKSTEDEQMSTLSEPPGGAPGPNIK